MFTFVTPALAEQFNESESSPYRFVANEEQLEELNILYQMNPNISHGAVLSVIAPDYWNSLPNVQKNVLLNSYFDESPSVMPRGIATSCSSSLSAYGSSLRHTSSHNTSGDSYTYETVISRVKNMDTNRYYGYAVDSCDEDNPASSLSASGIIDPPSGNYRAYGNHLIYNDVYMDGREFISQSSTRSYVNPYD